MTEKEMWEIYTKNNNINGKTYDAWCFGGDASIANKLAKNNNISPRTKNHAL